MRIMNELIDQNTKQYNYLMCSHMVNVP